MSVSTEVERWAASRPPQVAEVVRRYPFDICYRLRGTPGHYCIVSYGEKKDGTVELQIQHGPDSVLPGVEVFGVLPKSLVPCGCVKAPPLG